MSTKHTPGPWEAVKSSLHTDTTNLRQDIVSHCAVFSPAFVAGDILPADARLIASAPELLEALEWAVKLMSGEAVPAGCEQAARAAIAKAKGHQ